MKTLLKKLVLTGFCLLTLFGEKMKRLIVLLALVIFMSGCGSGEPVPFNAGDYFVYKSKSFNIKFTIDETTNGRYEVLWDFGDKNPLTLIIDSKGKIIGATHGKPLNSTYDKRQIFLWLPPSKRKIGQKIDFGDFFEENRISEETTWNNWDVWVSLHKPIGGMFGWQKSYYDKETGFLVGSETADGFTKILIDTNIDALL